MRHSQGVGHEEAYTIIAVNNKGVTSCSQSGVSASKGTAQIFPVPDITGSSKMLKTDLKMNLKNEYSYVLFICNIFYIYILYTSPLPNL